MQCNVGIAPYIVVAETNNLEKRLIFYIQNKKTHRVTGVFCLCGFGDGGGMSKKNVILF